MSTKDSKYYERRLKRLQKQVDTGTALRHTQQAAVVKYKDQLKGMLEAQIRIARLAGDEVARLKETTVANAMTIRELNDQLAVQWKQRAEAASDLKQVQDSAARSIASHNRQVQIMNELRAEVKQVTEDREAALAMLADAQTKIHYRLWQVILGFMYRSKAGIRTRYLRAKNNWLIHRLNGERRAALKEAGHIPENLIHMAHKYWEHDQKRLEDDEQIIHTTYYPDKQAATYARKPGLLRRFKIWCGRA